MSRKLVRRLSFEIDTDGNIQNFAFVRPYLFRIIHVFWTARGCVDGDSFHDLLPFEIEYRHHFPVVLRIHNLPSLSGRVFGEQQGNAAEIISRIGVEHGNRLQIHIFGWD